MSFDHKRFIALALSLAMALSMAACGGSVPELLDSGANSFADGKQEDDYSLRGSGELLQSMLDKYSGSYRMPDSSQMDDDDYDDAKKKADEENPVPPVDPSDDPSAPTIGDDEILVGSWEELLDAFYGAYYRTDAYLEFELTGGYSVDLSWALQESYNELQRRDPIFVSCVKNWSWGSRGDEYIIEIGYTIDTDELNRIKADTQRYVDEAVARIGPGSMSDYEIVCAVNDYLCDTVYYPEEPYAPMTHTAYGALADGVAVCEGYACAAKLLLDTMGVPCDIQFGTCTNGGGHAWNLVQLEDQWYQMDVTWNDGALSRSDYLLVTDAFMRQSRTWDESNYPACANTPYSP